VRYLTLPLYTHEIMVLIICLLVFRYLATIQFVGNGFLKAQGYSKAALFDPARPSESLSMMVNAIFKRQFGLKVNSAIYIKPAVSYIQVRQEKILFFFNN
jgi:hypothetical protein